MVPKYRSVALHLLLSLVVSFALSACGNKGDRRVAIPTLWIAGIGNADVKTLVVVLPGRRDNVEVMQKLGVAEAIHAGWPEVDVQLTSTTLAYYTDGNLARRVREQILDPARMSGYQRITVMGASLGGMGSLIVDEGNPGIIDHLILMAPYLGEKSLLRRIQADGGIAKWDAGAKPPTVDRDTFQRELWRHIQSFTQNAESRSRVWLAYGEADSLAATVPIIRPALNEQQILPRAGGHKWTVWNAVGTEIFSTLRLQAMPTGQ